MTEAMEFEYFDYNGHIVGKYDTTVRDLHRISPPAEALCYHTRFDGSRILHPQTIIEIARTGCIATFGTEPDIEPDQLTARAEKLVYRNLLVGKKLNVTVSFFPAGTSRTDCLMDIEGISLYSRYDLNYKRVSCNILRYQIPFSPFPTVMSRNIHLVATQKAMRSGYDNSLMYTDCGLVSLAQWPLFAMSGTDFFTLPIAAGAAQHSLQREIGMKMIRAAGYRLTETESILNPEDFDEFFAVTNEGITSVGSIDGKSYPFSAAQSLIPVLRRMEQEIR